MSTQKIILTVMLCLIMGLPSIAQSPDENKDNEPRENRTEFNIGISDIFSKPSWIVLLYDNNEYNYHNLNLNPKQTSLVAGMKFHDKRGAIRLSTTFSYRTESYDNLDSPGDKNTVRSISSNLNLGYEWHTIYERITVYYGFDATIGYQNHKTINDDYFDLYESKLKVMKYGISPLLGVNYFITPKLSIGTEIKFSAMGYSGKSESTFQNGIPPYVNNGDTNDKFKGFQTYFGPLGYLSVNIYF